MESNWVLIAINNSFSIAINNSFSIAINNRDRSSKITTVNYTNKITCKDIIPLAMTTQ
jgi:hypothetical protein